MIPHITAGAAAKWGAPFGVVGATTVFANAIPTEAWVAGISTIGVVLTGYFAARQSRTERKVDGNRLLTDQLQEQLAAERSRGDVLEERIRNLSNELDRVRYEHTLYRIGTATLTGQLVALGETPSWIPPKETQQ